MNVLFHENCKSVFIKSENCFEKKNVYSSVSMNLRIVFKTFQKTDFFLKRLRTAIDANTDQNDDRKKNKKCKKTIENKKTFIQNVLKKQKTKNRKLFKLKIQKRHELSSKK